MEERDSLPFGRKQNSFSVVVIVFYFSRASKTITLLKQGCYHKDAEYLVEKVAVMLVNFSEHSGLKTLMKFKLSLPVSINAVAVHETLGLIWRGYINFPGFSEMVGINKEISG